jgi:hypothetical protein
MCGRSHAVMPLDVQSWFPEHLKVFGQTQMPVHTSIGVSRTASINCGVGGSGATNLYQ